MAYRASQKLVEFLEQRTGQHLRTAAHYDEGSYEFLYVRDEIEAEYSDEEFEAHFETFRRDAVASDRQESLLDAGNHHCTLRVYDETLVFTFTQSQGVHTMISLDPEAGMNLITFVKQCLEQLHANSPAGGDAKPGWIEA